MAAADSEARVPSATEVASSFFPYPLSSFSLQGFESLPPPRTFQL